MTVFSGCVIFIASIRRSYDKLKSMHAIMSKLGKYQKSFDTISLENVALTHVKNNF